MTKADDMTEILIKPRYHDTVIAFNNSGVVLNKRSQQDLIDLGIMAHQSQNPNLLCLFENLPPLAELQQMKLGNIEAQVMVPKTVKVESMIDNKTYTKPNAGTKEPNKK